MSHKYFIITALACAISLSAGAQVSFSLTPALNIGYSFNGFRNQQLNLPIRRSPTPILSPGIALTTRIADKWMVEAAAQMFTYSQRYSYNRQSMTSIANDGGGSRSFGGEGTFALKMHLATGKLGGWKAYTGVGLDYLPGYNGFSFWTRQLADFYSPDSSSHTSVYATETYGRNKSVFGLLASYSLEKTLPKGGVLGFRVGGRLGLSPIQSVQFNEIVDHPNGNQTQTYGTLINRGSQVTLGIYYSFRPLLTLGKRG